MSILRAVSLVAAAAVAAAYPTPSALPPRDWKTVGSQLFMHGCNRDGLFNESELALAAKYSILTVEKGQGLELPGYAEDKMEAIAAQWKTVRPDGWALFYMNIKLDWTFYRLHAVMEAHSHWAAQRDGLSSGKPCKSHGDSTFPQPDDGLLCFNHSVSAMRDAFIATCVNATSGSFNGCFLDSAMWGRGSPGKEAKLCNTSKSAVEALGSGTETLMRELQATVGDGKLIVAKDGAAGGSEELVNTVFPMDTFCSCYKCKDWTKDGHQGQTYDEVCQTQILTTIHLGKRRQAVLLHGEVNSVFAGNASALEADFEFALAAYLVAAGPTTWFGYSDGWYYSGTQWHPAFDRPLGAPTADAVQGTGEANMTWTRTFASGTKVWIDVKQHEAEISWAE